MPKIQIPRKLLPIQSTKKPYVILAGGRSSCKSGTTARELVRRAQVERADVLCGREFQNSIEDSVHKIIKNVINNHNVQGFNITDSKIDCVTGGGFRFKGFNRNPGNIKSAEDFKYSWFEEAQYSSQETLELLLPTIRSAGSQLFFSLNPGSSEDPISKEFLTPYWDHILKYGYYEDDLHLIIHSTYKDNPWHDEVQEAKRLKAFETMSRAKYDHIWLGMFNDEVEDSLIIAEWFDACVDAHKRLGIAPSGMILAAHDPSDTGPDPKAYALRHGCVVTKVEERDSGDVNEGSSWATGMAIRDRADSYTWDGDGMGLALKSDVATAFKGKHTKVKIFRGSEDPDNPDSIYDGMEDVADGTTIGDLYRNKRAQYYFELRESMRKTYNAVVNGVYTNPDDIISFSSEMPLLQKLRSELCRIPIKPNRTGKLELYTKEEMKKKFKISSPNLADSCMMLMRVPDFRKNNVVIPQPMRPMGIVNNGRAIR